MRVLMASILAATIATVGVGCHTELKNHLPPAGAVVHQNNLPPAEMLMHPGPGVDGPGPGVMMCQPGAPSPNMTSQVAFVGPEGMTVVWDIGAPGAFDSPPLVCPGRYNFPQGAIYRLKISNIPGRPGIELYPTLEVGPVMPRTEAFLAHNAIPVQFTEEDFDQVLTGNFVTKVIYLPDPEYQELALAGVETLVSTRLDPGVDPIVEADRRGAILAIVRLGNKDLQAGGGQGNEGGVVSTGYQSSSGCPRPGGPLPMGMPMGGGYSTMPGGGVIAGVTGPQYGMPMCGTPIGLPGPPSVPLGVPAGLQSQVMKNHTRYCLPKPTEHVRIDVKQTPGYSYPQPDNHVRIVERAGAEGGWFHQPLGDRHERVCPEGGDAPCEGACPVQ
jgi:hypothetical protein